MTVTLPTDGFGVYEEVRTSLGSGVWQPRLNAIAAGGFKLVLNYDTPFGHTSDIIAYINGAASVGLKVIVALGDPAIWRDNTYATTYPLLYADAGNPATGTAFMQYLVNQVKALPGVWGYYVSDENVAADHAVWSPYAASVKAADPLHPRLAIGGAGGTGAQNFYLGNTLYFDQVEVGGDDYYPIGDAGAYSATTAQIASGIQSFCTSKGLGSAMVLQAQSWQQYYPPARCTSYPDCAPWPGYNDMRASVVTALSNMKPRLILWYSYFDAVSANAPAGQFTAMSSAIANLGAVFSQVQI